MAGKPYFYLIDNLTSDTAVGITMALRTVSDVLEVKPHLAEGVIEVRALKDVEPQIKLACGVAKATYRMRISRRSM